VYERLGICYSIYNRKSTDNYIFQVYSAEVILKYISKVNLIYEYNTCEKNVEITNTKYSVHQYK